MKATSQSGEKQASKRKANRDPNKPHSKKRKAADPGKVVDGPNQNGSRKLASNSDAATPAAGDADGAAAKKSRLDPDTLTYLHEIEEHFKTLPDDESKELLVCNVLEELSGKELRIVSDGEGSRIIESLIQRAPAAQLIQFLSAFNDTDSLFRVASSPFGSHTLEKALKALHKHVGHLDEETYATVEQLVSTLVATVSDHLYDYLMDRTAAYLPRQLLNLVAGREVSPSGKAKVDSTGSGRKDATSAGLASRLSAGRESETATIPFPDALQALAQVILGPNYSGTIMEDLAGSPTAGPFLQGLLRAAQGNSQLLEQLIIAMLGGSSTLKPGDVVEDRGLPLDGLDQEHVRSYLEHGTASRLVEVAVAVATPDIFQDFLSRFITGKAAQLAMHPSANFVLQAAIGAAHKPAQVKSLVLELAGQVKDLFRRRRGGVVAALAASSARLKAGQSELVRALSTALLPEGATAQQNTDNKEGGGGANAALVRALACLDTTVELGTPGGKGPSSRLSTLGCATLASILHFAQATCRPFTKGLLALTREQLLHLCLDPSGSRVVEAFLESDAQLGPKRGMVRRLQGSYADIALKSFGSFLMEKCYEWSDLDLKEAIVSELVAQEKQMNATHWGPFLLRKVAADAYQRDPEQWRRRAQSSAQVLSEFADIFGSGDDAVRKGKKGGASGEPHTAGDKEQGTKDTKGKRKRRVGDTEAAEEGGEQQPFKTGKRGRRGGVGEDDGALGADQGVEGDKALAKKKKGKHKTQVQDVEEEAEEAVGAQHSKARKVEQDGGAQVATGEGASSKTKSKLNKHSKQDEAGGKAGEGTLPAAFGAALEVLGFAGLADTTSTALPMQKKVKKQPK